MSYNKFIVMGRLTRDPELRITPNGTPVCECGMAFDNGWGDNKRPCFIEVTVWGKQAEFVKNYFKKGSGILVDGRLEFDQWDDKETGKKLSKHYITAERVTFTISDARGSENSKPQESSSAEKRFENTEDVPF